MRLYTYWRSTTAYRIRIALNLKGIAYEPVPINLVDGEQTTTSYKALNPIAGVPALELDEGAILTQSMAILEYLEDQYPEPTFLPDDPVESANIRAAAMIVASDIHPINNLKVGKKLKELGHAQDEVIDWMLDWMARGFEAYQALLPDAQFSFGQQPTMADICLVPQLYNAHRWGLDLAPFTRLTEIETRCLVLPAFAVARPENQPDAI
ncbi:MAG: maleylacetoacetate isomerase [Pseudomonadota bacterium]